MIDSILQTSVTYTSTTLGEAILVILMSLVLGSLISMAYKWVAGKTYSETFFITLLLLPALIGTIILLVGDNVAGAFSLAGIFSVIRFRSAPGNARDIVFILFATAVGLAVGTGSYLFSVIIAGVISLVIIGLYSLSFWKKDSSIMYLKILVPENTEIDRVLDPVIKAHTKEFSMLKLKTTDLGSLYEVSYEVVLKDDTNRQKFIDELRCLNGNLTINLNNIGKQMEF